MIAPPPPVTPPFQAGGVAKRTVAQQDCTASRSVEALVSADNPESKGGCGSYSIVSCNASPDARPWTSP
jgi:hypothetical protein